jgi:tripartite-type tricarboxylate transporter receptor subunit TctC
MSIRTWGEARCARERRPAHERRARRAALRALAAAAIAAVASPAPGAEQYPDRPIRLMVPWAPGGTTDILARTVAEKLTQSLGQPVIVENKPGASGNIGSDVVAKAKPDGYTLLFGSMSTHAMNPALMASMPFRGVVDFTPIAMLAFATNTLVLHPSVPANNMRELIAYMKANPGRLVYASAGPGSTNHLSAVLLERMAGVTGLHVPYKGGQPAVMDTVAGTTQMFVTAATQSLPHVKAGKLKLVAVTESRRSALFPDVPTVAETLPGYDVTVWYGAFGPAGMPRELVARLNAEINRAMSLPDVKSKLDAIGVEGTPTTPEKFAATLRADADRWGRIIREMGIKGE